MSAVRSTSTPGPLRDRQVAATREEIITTAMALLAESAESSHELIAKAAGMSSRTVYRHFPDRSSLMLGVWQRLREMMQIRFPASEEDIVPLTRQAFDALNENETLVHVVMSSLAGAHIGNLPGYEGREAFTASLLPRLAGLPSKERRWIVGSFVALYSAPFWQLLRTRGELSAAESVEATTWILTTLLDALKSKSKKRKQTK